MRMATVIPEAEPGREWEIEEQCAFGPSLVFDPDCVTSAEIGQVAETGASKVQDAVAALISAGLNDPALGSGADLYDESLKKFADVLRDLLRNRGIEVT